MKRETRTIWVALAAGAVLFAVGVATLEVEAGNKRARRGLATGLPPQPVSAPIPARGEAQPLQPSEDPAAVPRPQGR